MNLGLDKNNLKKSAHILSQYLADTYYLYFKTHTFHWNVAGPHFYSLHKLFDEQYSALFESIDEIAERIRSLDCAVPASFVKFQSLSCLKDVPEAHLDDKGMITCLLNDQELIITNLRMWITELGELNDMASQDFLIGRLAEHEKMGWMLRAQVAT
jgi:starvation-inducible DNA-binding protein